VFLTWLATRHPIAAALIVAGFLAIIVVVMRWVVRAMTRALKNLFHSAENGTESEPENDLAPSKRHDLDAA
jgi:hypothetical protein